MKKIFVIPPAFAALAFTIPASLQLMHRPDSIYIPLVVEGLVFAVAYVAFSIINSISIAPLSMVLASHTLNRVAGVVFAIAVAVLGSIVVFAFDGFGHKATIVHRAYVFGSFLPLLLAAFGAFHFAAQRRRAMAQESNADR